LISLFQNLLDNAQKYSPDGSEINIYSESNSSKIIICISDQGVGIAEDEKSKIFDRFYRIEDEETRSFKGTGLGLFLVNQIVKMHGGKIICKNNTPCGSIFELQFKK
jgi:signal transduction histidine kinase